MHRVYSQQHNLQSFARFGPDNRPHQGTVSKK
jgi:hypothetical protein